MVKECLVKLNNEVVTVVRYGDVDVQLPAIHREAKTIFVACEDGKYSVVDKSYKPKGASVNEKKRTNKKTTVEEVAKELDTAIEDNKDA